MKYFILGMTIFMLFGYSLIFSQNQIVIENALPGYDLDVCYQGSCGIWEGFATELGVNKGDTVHFKIDGSDGQSFMIKNYRLGYYQGLGARLQATIGPFTGINQPEPNHEIPTSKVDCENWIENAQWIVPSTIVSGLFQAVMEDMSGEFLGSMIFIIRDDASNSDLLYKTSDATWQAYNSWGGYTFYSGGAPGPPALNHAAKLSYQRPFFGVGSQNFFGQTELALIRWMERNGYDVSYTTQLDMARDGSAIITPAMHKILISAGHDEYWSAECRTVWETARDNGVNLCFFSGNEIYWKTRWEDNMKTLVCYKEGELGENQCGYKCDTSTDIWTGLWRSGGPPQYPNSDGGKPENQLTGQISWMPTTGTITVPSNYRDMRFWKNTEVANLLDGQSLDLAPNTLGSEWDQYHWSGFYPPRRILLSSTQFSGQTHNLSLYRHSSGALVFGAGTIRWSWGLYADHEDGPSVEDLNMKQATVNLFAYMGVPPDPAYLEPGIFPETGATSNTPPITEISSPVNGSTLSSSTVTITGTSSTPAGAVLVGVEVSTDGGLTWFPASGSTNWSFSWNPGSQGSFVIKARGWDDLGNVEMPGSVPVDFSNCISVTFNGPSVHTIFLPNQPGGDPQNGTGPPLEVGMRFRSSMNGYITSLRYYKIAGTTGIHTGHLWANTGGAPLATVTFINETSSGWQTATLASPYEITANTLYIVSYFNPSGEYPSSTLNYFTSDVVNGMLTAPAAENGLYIYSPISAFPSSYTYTNYWVDIEFSTTLGPDETPPTVINISPINNATGVPAITNPSVTFSEALDPATVNTNTFILEDAGANLVDGTVSYISSTNTAIFAPSVPLDYSTTYTAKIIGGLTDPRITDPAGNPLVSDSIWIFTTENLYLPSVTEHPSSQSSCSGSIISFNSVATGNPPPTIQWQVSSDDGNNWSDIPGAITSPYTFIVAITDDNNQYRAVWTNIEGSINSDPATLAVAAGISGTIDAVNSEICQGDSFQLQLTTATGQSPYTIITNGKTYSGVTVGSTFATIPTADESIWAPTATPSSPDNPLSTPFELGVTFIPLADGYIKGIRFYKGILNTGVHAGHLWTANGTLLASATFTNESSSGWQQVLFSTPVAVSANTTYVASYSDPAGHFSQTTNFFIDNTPITSANGLLQTLSSTGSGVYSETVGAFPNLISPLLTNYWVDVVYAYSIQPTSVTNNISSISDDGTCTITGNPLSSVVISINNTNAPIVSSPLNYFEGATAVPLTAAGTNLLWYTVSIGGQGSSAAPIPSTAVPGITSYFVSQTIDGCESVRAQINVVVSPNAEGWYNESWQYRRPAIAANTCGTSLTDYQVLISLDSSFDFTKTNTDGSDIRVTDADGITLLPFWIESWNANTQQARIWINMPVISTGGSTAYLYYGNAAATSISNGNSTFILFDDAWTLPSWITTGNPTISNGIISFSTGQSLESSGNYSPGHALGFRANYKGANNYKWTGFISGLNEPLTIIQVDPSVGPNLILANDAIGTKVTASLGNITDSFHVYELGWLNGETRAFIDYSSSPVAVLNSQVPSTPLPITITNHLDGSFGLEVDWIYLRKLSSCDPISIVGVQQIFCPPPVPNVISPVTYCMEATAIPLTAGGSNLLWYTDPIGGTGSSTAPTPSTVSAGLISYYVTQTLNSCESDRSQIDVVVNETPGAPTANITEPTCEIPTGTITVISAPIDLSFSIDGIDYTNITGIFTDVIPGSYNLTAKNNSDCISQETAINIIAFPGSPLTPAVTVTQPTCTVSTGTITITSPTGTGMTYSIDGVDYTNATGIFTEINSGTYAVTAKDISDCISLDTSVTVDPAPAILLAPTVDITQPTCSDTTGTITVTSITTELFFSIDGIDYTNTSGIFINVNPGTYNLTAKNSNDCISPSTILTIDSGVTPPTASISAVINNLCYNDPTYQLQLSSATGQPPYTIIVDGKTYTDVTEGQTFASPSIYESFWDNSTSGILTEVTTSDWELGVKFRTTEDGYIRGIRFHKDNLNTGVHVGSLWIPTSATTGTKLASATFTNETSSGWQEVIFAEPIAVTANSVYIASYTDPNGYFSKNSSYFSSGITSGNLYAFSQTDPSGFVVGNGVYNANPGSFPFNNGSANYWVDIIFSTSDGSTPFSITPQLTSLTTGDGCTNTGNPLSSTTITINASPGGTILPTETYCANDMRLIFNASSGIEPFSLTVNEINYQNIYSGVPFDVGASGTNQSQSIWPSSANGIIGAADNSSVELGVKFRSSEGGQITGIRFNKRAAQAGLFTGTLWSGTGTMLATATFSNIAPGSTGWQQVNFNTPVTIEPNTTYVASYHSPNGNYYNDVDYFSNSGITNGSLTALQSGVDGVNGVYIYSSSTAFPNLSPQNTNYWVDVVFSNENSHYFSLTSISDQTGCETSGLLGTAINVSQGTCGKIKALLQGPYNGGGLMNKGLVGNIPLDQPYNVEPWFYNGGESLLVMDTSVVDWVLVELRSDINAITERKAALLLEDGKIVQYNKISDGIHFENIMEGTSYYIVVYHRNHMPIMTSGLTALDGTLVDFTFHNNCYGYPNAEIELETGSGVYGMIAGDINSNGRLSYSGPGNDRGLILAKIVEKENTTNITAVTSGYYAEDLLLDYEVKYIGSNNDRAIILTNLGELTGSEFINASYQSVVPLVTTKTGSQNDGPIQIFLDETMEKLQVKITTNEYIPYGMVDNIQFTLSWDADLHELVAPVLEQNQSNFGLVPQGTAKEYEGNMYLVYASVIPAELPAPFTVDDEVTLISFTKNQVEDMVHKISIAENTYTNNSNGMYYISLWGKDHTGTILENMMGKPEVQSFGLSIYPNPVSLGFVHVEMNVPQPQDVSIKVMDLFGKFIFSEMLHLKAGKSNNQIDLQKIPNGIYFIKFENAHMKVIKKLVIL